MTVRTQDEPKILFSASPSVFVVNECKCKGTLPIFSGFVTIHSYHRRRRTTHYDSCNLRLKSGTTEYLRILLIVSYRHKRYCEYEYSWDHMIYMRAVSERLPVRFRFESLDQFWSGNLCHEDNILQD